MIVSLSQFLRSPHIKLRGDGDLKLRHPRQTLRRMNITTVWTSHFLFSNTVRITSTLSSSALDVCDDSLCKAVMWCVCVCDRHWRSGAVAVH